MGIDYNGVGGIGIEVTSEMFDAFEKNGLFTKEERDIDGSEVLSKTSFPWSDAGNSYAYESRCYLFVPGKNLTEINKNAPEFIKKLTEYDIHLSESDLIVIEDLYIW